MKTKNFKDYLEKKLDHDEILEIEEMATIEFEAIKALQQDVSEGLASYMEKEAIGFNELVRRLGISASQAIKMQRGEANLTLASLAHLAALFKKKPHLIFK